MGVTTRIITRILLPFISAAILVTDAAESSSHLSKYEGKWALKEIYASDGEQRPLPASNSGEPFFVTLEENQDGNLDIELKVINYSWTTITFLSDNADGDEIKVEAPFFGTRIGLIGEVGDLEKDLLQTYLPQMNFIEIVVSDNGEEQLIMSATSDVADGMRIVM